MSRSFPKNHKYWQDWSFSPLEGDSGITDGACIISGCYGSFVDGGYLIFSNFGNSICYSLAVYISDNLADLDAKPQQKPSDEQRLADLIAAEQALDDLLGEFLEQGYQAGMKERLQEIVNHAPTALQIEEIFVLPEDLDALLLSVGNPLTDEDADENEGEAEANVPIFDLHNPEHCNALDRHIQDLNS